MVCNINKKSTPTQHPNTVPSFTLTFYDMLDDTSTCTRIVQLLVE